MNVVIMRGLPGSGKSTWVNRQPGRKVTCSADDYHTVDGEYRYDPKKAGEAHDWCLRKFITELMEGIAEKTIYVDNTNTSLVEVAPYARLSSALAFSFRVVYVHCDLVVAHSRNVHDVPFATMLKMQKQLLVEELPPYWLQELVI